MYRNEIVKHRWILLSYTLIALFFAFILPTHFVAEQEDSFLGPSGLIYTRCYQHAVDVFGVEFPGKLYAFGWHMNNETFQCDDLQS